MIHPLPKGEGRGEGKGDKIQPASLIFLLNIQIPCNASRFNLRDKL
jgi:hypothetical protein